MENKHTWEERFILLLDPLFVPPSHAGQSPVVDWSHWHSKESYERIKSQLVSFIEKEIDLAVKRREGEMRKEIEGMSFVDSRQAGQFAMHADGYNQAIEEVLDLLTHKGRD